MANRAREYSSNGRLQYTSAMSAISAISAIIESGGGAPLRKKCGADNRRVAAHRAALLHSTGVQTVQTLAGAVHKRDIFFEFF